jgi:hypothetical protein
MLNHQREKRIVPSQTLQPATKYVVGSLRRSAIHACPADACGCQGTVHGQLYESEQLTYTFLLRY